MFFSFSEDFVKRLVSNLSFFFIKTFSRINLTLSANSIDFHLIVFVFQIKNYRTLIKFNLTRTTSEKFLILINSITNCYARSSQSVVSRSSRRSYSLKLLIFSDNWRVNRSQLLSDIKKFYLNYIDYRRFAQYSFFENQIIKNIINISSKNFIQLLSNYNETTFDKFSLKSRLLLTSKFDRFVLIDSLKSIKLNLKQESSIDIAKMS